MPTFADDRSSIVIPFILERYARYRERNSAPFFIGLNGIQGVGKTTLVTALETTLRSSPHSLPTITLSLDDLYLPRSKQAALASSQPQNPLIQHRGQPGTHDLALGTTLFRQLKERESDICVPGYDKSAYDGKGDQAPEEEWRIVNKSGERKIEVVIFEGWCTGFRPLSKEEIERLWKEKVGEEMERAGSSNGRLGLQKLEDVVWINERLKEYNELTDYFDTFVHIDSEDTHYVYEWRLEAEHQLRDKRGNGMTDEQVKDFVNGYYPSYELFTQTLRRGIFPDEPGKQLRLVVNQQRKLVKHEVI